MRSFITTSLVLVLLASTATAQGPGSREAAETLVIFADNLWTGEQLVADARVVLRGMQPDAWAPDRDALMNDWSFAGVPLTILIDAEGSIVHVWDGAASMKSIEAEIETLLGAEPKPDPESK